MVVIGVALVIAVGHVVLGVSVPQNLPGFLVAFVLGVALLFALGLLVAAPAPSGQAAGAIGPLWPFPLLFFAGASMPKERIPEILARLTDFTPLSATMGSIRATWEVGDPQTLHLAVLAAFALVVSLLAVGVFWLVKSDTGEGTTDGAPEREATVRKKVKDEKAQVFRCL